MSPAFLRILLLVVIVGIGIWAIVYLWRKRPISPLKLYEDYLKYCIQKENFTSDDWKKLDQIERKSGIAPHRFASLRDKYDVKRPPNRT